MRAHQLRIITQSGLFDEDFYLSTYPDVLHADIPALDHFFGFGYLEGRSPNRYFEPLWYLGRNPDVAATGMHPLLHYILHGDRQGQDPGPLFDCAWYRVRYDVAAELCSLSHYLASCETTPLSPIPDFDAEYYAAHNLDVVAAKVDLFQHFHNYGHRECRNPSAEFDVKFYVERYLHGDTGGNPLLHYVTHRGEPGVFGRLPDDEPTVSREVRHFTKPSPDFEEFRGLDRGARPRVKLLAYYLPQFHAFEENDSWWGKGFIEWTNIARGSPRFVGHYQPRVPRDLGFYSLDSMDTMRRQIDMAQAAGVHGFVFYYYWFNGRRLMDRPLQRFLAEPALDMPFALMWANENWTRRWDGADSEVLISQDYRAQDDAAMAAEFAAHFKDPRYIRLQGRPVLMIYRPGLIPEPARTIRRWREMFRSEFGEDPILVMAQSFGADDPRAFGLDGAIEFPPHKLTSNLAPANPGFRYLDYDFRGKIYHYDDVVRVSLDAPDPGFPLVKTAVPSWDNDARRQGNGIVLAGSTPAKYETWMSQLAAKAQAAPFFGEAIVCVNAWNEWCEGAYLEPDLHFGAAYLNATARAVSGRGRQEAVPRIVLVGHDAFPSGAQQLLLGTARMLHAAFGMECEILLLDGGVLLDAYIAQAPTTVIASDAQLSAKLQSLAEAGFAGAVINTAAAARVTPYFQAAGLRTVLQIHELPRIIREKHLVASAKAGVDAADRVVFAAEFVRDSILAELGVAADERMVVMPQGSYRNVAFSEPDGTAARLGLGLGVQDRMVLGVGYADLRKGFDLFLQLWRLLQAPAGPGRTCLVWVGGMDPALRDWLGAEIAEAEACGTFRMAGYRDDMAAVFSAADAFVLTSREDPFPTVVMEALGAGLPVFAFDRAGGIPDMLRETGEGHVLPYGDIVAMADAVRVALAAGISPEQRAARQALVATRFDFRDYAGRLLRLVLPGLPSVSVVVPNYNYARFMPDRLGSIFQQSHPVHEVIVLDDCSTDNSLAVIPVVAEKAGRRVRLVPNAANSGSVFAQWRRAAELADGEFLWIAEADDLSDRGFLANVLALMTSDPAIGIGFCDSRTIDLAGSPQWGSYKEYYASVEPGALARTEVFDAASFVERFLSVRNLILNVSAVVWRRRALLQALDSCEAALGAFRMAGDWRLYLEVLRQGGRVAYVAEPLNVHRRHAQSVTHALDGERHVDEIRQCHALVRDAWPLSEARRAQQAHYLAEVATQLGVPPGGKKISVAVTTKLAAGVRKSRNATARGRKAAE
ncbi:MAG: glycoside hydrolase family 99-like domain-containing protein [Janthinobacterium lividum]